MGVKPLDSKQTCFNAPFLEIWLELPIGEVVQACEAVYGLQQSEMECCREPRKSIMGAGWESSAHGECSLSVGSGDGYFGWVRS